jgi:multidrug efflux system outer membrane protein
MHTNIRLLCLMLTVLPLSGCRVGPRYSPPCTAVPEAWKNEHIPENDNDSSQHLLDNWWEIFNDPCLDALEADALLHSPTLDIAMGKVLEARALAGVAASALYPQLFLNPSFSDTGTLFQPFLPGNLLNATGATTPGKLSSTTIAPFRVHQMQYMLPLNLNFELDLFGMLHDRYDSAKYNAQAEAYNYQSILLTLTADIATAYFQLRILDAQVLLLKSTIDSRQSNLKLTQSRYDKGLVNYLDVTQAQIDLATAKASLDNSRRLRELAENQIATLTGNIATEYFMAPIPLKTPPPLMPAGLPSLMLLRRPDLARAERLMASEHALINAAYASFFPSFSLTGALGFASPDIRQFLRWISRYWAIGANMSQMVFDGGHDCYDLQVALARFKQASASYQQTVLVAFQEVENALSDIEQFQKQTTHLNEAVVASKKATELSKNRYVKGVAIYLEVVENERLSLQTEIEWLNAINQQYAATVQLIKALGGSAIREPL